MLWMTVTKPSPGRRPQVSETSTTHFEFIEQAKRWCESLAPLTDGEVCCKLADLLAENARLQQWKAEALLVESEWNEQAVGKLLGIKPGHSVRAGIEPAVRQLQNQITALTRQLAEREARIKQLEGAIRHHKRMSLHEDFYDPKDWAQFQHLWKTVEQPPEPAGEGKP